MSVAIPFLTLIYLPKYNVLITGNFFYALILYQCSVYITKVQYDRSRVILTGILSEKATADAFGKECVDAMVSLQSKLRERGNS